jgi:ribonuclease-3
LIREALQCPNQFNTHGNYILALAGDAVLRQILVDQGRDKEKSPGGRPMPYPL